MGGTLDSVLLLFVVTVDEEGEGAAAVPLTLALDFERVTLLLLLPPPPLLFTTTVLLVTALLTASVLGSLLRPTAAASPAFVRDVTDLVKPPPDAVVFTVMDSDEPLLLPSLAIEVLLKELSI